MSDGYRSSKVEPVRRPAAAVPLDYDPTVESRMTEAVDVDSQAVQQSIKDLAVNTIDQLDALMKEIDLVKEAIIQGAGESVRTAASYFGLCEQAMLFRDQCRTRLNVIANKK